MLDQDADLDVKRAPQVLPPVKAGNDSGSSSPVSCSAASTSSGLAANADGKPALGPAAAFSFGGAAGAGNQRAPDHSNHKLLMAAKTITATNRLNNSLPGFVGQKIIKQFPSSLPEKARLHLEENAEVVHYVVGPKDGHKQMLEVLREMDKDTLGVIQYGEWVEYCKYVHHNRNYIGENKYKNVLDEQLQLMILSALHEHEHDQSAASMEETFHALFCVFDENDSAKMTFEEFEDGLMALGLLPHNFVAPNGKRKQYAPRSLYIFSANNPIREGCVYLALNKWFDAFILLCIIANSVILAMQDYEDVGSLPEPTSPDYRPNAYNQVVDGSEIVFNVIFTMEFVIKVIAMGFWMDPGSYLRDYWNWLDFMVVVIGLIGTMPGMGNFSSLRTFRVMRPLRTLTALPGMRVLISALLSAIPLMVDVLMILAFVFTIFGVLGVQLFNGWQHHYCRATEFPTQESIPGVGDAFVWNLADRDGTRVCDPTGNGYACPAHPDSGMPTFCGSEWEVPLGHTVTHHLLPPESVSFGYTGFDNILRAWLTIFQCITMEGWVIVMYQLIDASSGASSSMPPCSIYFILLIVLGSFFLMEFVFAVIFYRFTLCHDGHVKVHHAKLDKKIPEESHVHLKYVAGDDGFHEDEVAMAKEQGEIDAARQQQQQGMGMGMGMGMGTGSAKVNPEGETIGNSSNTHNNNNNNNNKPKLGPIGQLQSLFHDLVSSVKFELTITLCIVVNTVTLALNTYPENESRVVVVEHINLVLTYIFLLEMLFKLVGLGVREYVRDSFNLFDASIVMVSMFELVMAHISGSDDRSALSALRAFRLFRIFKLARSWVTLRNLLSTIARTLKEMGNFLLLLVLFMYIVALVGMQFFATRFKFHPDTGVAVEWEPAVYQVDHHHPPIPCGAEFCWQGGSFPDDLDGAGRQLAALDAPYVESRSNFNNLANAFITVFQILTGEDWNMVMYDGIRCGGFIATGYFIVVQILGNTIILNLFLAILAINFEMDDGEDDDDGDDNGGGGGVDGKSSDKDDSSKRRSSMSLEDQEEEKTLTNEDAMIFRASHRHATKHVMQAASSVITTNTLGGVGSSCANADALVRKVGAGAVSTAAAQDAAEAVVATAAIAATVATAATAAEDDETKKEEPYKPFEFDMEKKPLNFYNGTAAQAAVVKRLSIFNDGEGGGGGEEEVVVKKRKGYTTGFRGKMADLIADQRFDNCVLFCILVSSVLLAIDNPLDDPESTGVTIIKGIDLVLTVLFILEMTIKLTGLGVRTYWSDGWNVLDGTIVIVSIINLSAGDGGGSLKSLRSLRALRALRPLRVISRAPSLKKVVNALLAAIPPAMNVTLVCLLFFLIFAIVLTDTFKGKLFSCDFDSLTPVGQRALAYDYGLTKLTYKKPFMKTDCLRYNGTWANANSHFDHVGQSMSTLFQMSTTEGWMEVMFQAIDAVAEEQNPVQDWDRSKSLLFIAFMVVGFMFAVNLFVGSVMDTFDKMNKRGESLFLTPEQQEWVDTMRMMAKVGNRIQPRAPAPDNCYRRVCYNLASNFTTSGLRLERFIMLCIMLNTVVMASVHFQMAPVTTLVIDTANNAFALIFFFEAVVKITGLGWVYFKNSWNIFDLVIVMATILCFVLEEAAGLEIGNLANLARAFRMALIFRLFKSMKDLQTLLGTMLANLVPVANITALLFLMLFIYTVMGVQLFSSVMAPQEQLSDFSNFQTFGKAFFLLFRSLTGEAWNAIMFELNVQNEDGDPLGCITDPTWVQMEGWRVAQDDPNAAIGCGPPVELISIYYLTFVIITSFIVLNLFIAVIIGGFEEAMKNENSFSQEVFEHFADEWALIDHDGDMFMTQEELLDLLTPQLLTDMGFNTQYLHCDVDRVKLIEFVQGLELKNFDGNVYFPNVAKMLGLKSFELSVKKKTGNADVGDLLREAPELDESAWPLGKNTEKLMEAALNSSALVIQGAYRKRKAKRLLAEKKRVRDMKLKDEGLPPYTRRASVGLSECLIEEGKLKEARLEARGMSNSNSNSNSISNSGSGSGSRNSSSGNTSKSDSDSSSNSSSSRNRNGPPVPQSAVVQMTMMPGPCASLVGNSSNDSSNSDTCSSKDSSSSGSGSAEGSRRSGGSGSGGKKDKTGKKEKEKERRGSKGSSRSNSPAPGEPLTPIGDRVSTLTPPPSASCE